MNSRSSLSRILFLLCVFTTISWHGAAIAAQLQLTWIDNSTDEVGFKIERKTGTTGTYAQIASLGANVTSYTDSTLMNATTYCFRVNAFNANGNSPYSPEACGTTASTIQTFSLSMVKTGTGAGTVSSSPAGINCGSTCSGTFNSGTVVGLDGNPRCRINLRRLDWGHRLQRRLTHHEREQILHRHIQSSARYSEHRLYQYRQ